MDWIDSGFITGAADESAGSNRPQKPVWTVNALNTYVSGLLDKDVRLRSIDVSGEISGFKCYNKSGHLYFSVKDESTQGSTIELSCDGPLRAPYTCYLQGGLNFAASRAGVLLAVQKAYFKE